MFSQETKLKLFLIFLGIDSKCLAEYFLHFRIRDRNCLPFVSTRVHPPDVGGVRVANYFYFSVFLYFVFRRPVSCIPNVACVSGLSILDCAFGFL